MAKPSLIVPQPFLQLNAAAVSHLQFTLKPKCNLKKLKKDLSLLWGADVTGADDQTLRRLPGAGKHEFGAASGSVVTGFRPELWAELSGQALPANLTSFKRGLRGINGTSVPATQRDIWVWLNQSAPDLLFDSMRKVADYLSPHAEVSEEQSCFAYHNSITFDGFADGTGNPNALGSAEATIIAPEEPGEGGTTLLIQRWIMNIAEMRKLSVGAGERVYGRNKLSSRQLEPLPAASHVSRNQFYAANGKDTIDIVRRNAYFGDIEKAGVMFVGFCNNIDVTMGMLKQMLGIGPDGKKVTDALLKYSTAESGSVYFVPSLTALAKAGIKGRNQE